MSDYKTRFLWEAMEEFHVAATTPGARELNQWTTFRELMESGTIPVISSNLLLKEGETTRPLGERTRVVEVNGVQIGLFGLMGGDEFATARPPAGIEFEFLDPLETAREIVAELTPISDVIVLMSEMSADDTNRLLETVPGIDVALMGKQPTWSEEAKQTGKTITQATGIRGQYTGELILIVDPEGEIAEYGSRNRTLDKAIPEDEEMKARVTEAEDKIKQLQQELREKKQSQLEESTSPERFLGAETCKRCHEAQYTQWAGTAHARAFATLEKDQTHSDPNCVGCHVTGWQQPGGFVAAAGHSPDLRNVQCEACHGRGTEHDRTRQETWGPDRCTTCHSGEFGKDFDFAAALELVRH